MGTGLFFASQWQTSSRGDGDAAAAAARRERSQGHDALVLAGALVLTQPAGLATAAEPDPRDAQPVSQTAPAGTVPLPASMRQAEEPTPTFSGTWGDHAAFPADGAALPASFAAPPLPVEAPPLPLEAPPLPVEQAGHEPHGHPQRAHDFESGHQHFALGGSEGPASATGHSSAPSAAASPARLAPPGAEGVPVQPVARSHGEWHGEQNAPREQQPDTPGAAAHGTMAFVRQMNTAMTDHDANALSSSITYIERISDSIVVLGANIAIATATNIAPVSQLNQIRSADPAIGGVKSSNVAVTDNDATAIAFAGTYINYAYNSVIIIVNNNATAVSQNFSPIQQGNHSIDRFSDTDVLRLDGPNQTNVAISDNDSVALAEAGVVVNKMVDSRLAGAEAAPDIDAGQDLLLDHVASHPLWAEADEALESLLA